MYDKALCKIEKDKKCKPPCFGVIGPTGPTGPTARFNYSSLKCLTNIGFNNSININDIILTTNTYNN